MQHEPSPAAAIAAALAARAEEVCRRYLPNGRRLGRYWICGDLDGARGRSLFVRLAERATVLGGFAVAALCTALAGPLDAGIETVAAAWFAAGVWAFVSSLALAIRRGVRYRDWRSFGRYEMTDSTELIDWSTQTGQYAWMAVAEEHERLMRGD